ncbi:unnamed protein product [Calicophoron daubneyi]
MRPLRLCSWNVNGLRSLQQPLKPMFDSLDADIICLQETKSSRDLSSCWAAVDGYNSYFSHCTSKTGYSGVAVFCRDPIRPIAAAEGLINTLVYVFRLTTKPPIDSSEVINVLSAELNISADDAKKIDQEGRLLSVFFPSTHLKSCNANISVEKSLAVISVYMPRLNVEETKRLEFRILFERAVRFCAYRLLDSHYCIIAGDLNAYHQPIDCCDPDESQDNVAVLSSRQWLNELMVDYQRDPRIPLRGVDVGQFVDTFRRVHPQRRSAFTCWSARTGARETNYGVRLDYVLFDQDLMSCFDRSTIPLQADIMADFPGSDHCPVWSDVPLNVITPLDYPLPSICSRFWPQCQKKQTVLGDFAAAAVNASAVVGDYAALSKPKVKCIENGRPGQNKLKQTTLFPDSISKTRRESDVRETPCDKEESQIDLSEREKLEHIVDSAEIERTEKAQLAWRSLLSGPKQPPLCRGHKEKCVLRSVKQACTASGSRRGRRFWVCARPQGARDNPEARCTTFIWDDQYQVKTG